MLQPKINDPSNPLKDYFITQYEADRVVMQHSKTKAKFFYKQIILKEDPHQFFIYLNERARLEHENLVKLYYHHWKESTIGILSEFYTSHLEAEIKRRSRSKINSKMNLNTYFTEEQLVNTFSPIMSCLDVLHKQSIVHGFVKGRSIIVNENYETKLCDAIAIYPDDHRESAVLKHAYFPPQFQYSNVMTVEGDLWGLGMVILQATILECFEKFYDRNIGKISVFQIQKKTQQIPDIFTDEYVVAVKLLLSSDKSMRKQGIKVFSEGTIPEGIIYEQMRPQRKKKINQRYYDSQSPKKMPYHQNKQLILGTTSTQLQSGRIGYKQEVLNEHNNHTTVIEDKKTKIDFIKEKYRSRNSEQMEIKKKQIEKINKIIERSNAFVNQLMSKRTDKPNSLKIPSLNKTAMNISMSGYKRQFFNENTKKLDKTPARQKQEKQTLVSNATLLGVDVEVKSISCKESPKKLLYLKRQTEKLRSLSKKK